MSSESMLARLDQYYNEQGISAVGFKCPHRGECSSVCAPGQMATPQAAYVGPGYEEGKLPRLLFVSSDTCETWYKDHPEWVTLEGVRKITLSDRLKNSSNPNTHWHQTFDFARLLLAAFAKERLGVSLTINEAVEYFSHTRSVRCKDGTIGTREGNELMARNCKRFLKGEIQAMSPDIIVAQGARARNALWNIFPVIRQVSMPEYPMTYCQIVQLSEGHTAIRIVAKHPCARGRNGWKRGEKKQFMDWALKSVRELIPVA